MRYAPYSEETKAAVTMSESQLLEYFLTRVFETEEVWGLDDGCEWIMIERDGQWVMPIWPYQQFAVDVANTDWPKHNPTAESLEDFVYQTLSILIEEDAMLEVMSSPQRRGCLVSPHRLQDIFHGMFDAGEYTLDS